MSSRTEYTGKSVEAAIVEAEKQLGKTRDDLEIQILSQGSRGVFGIGGEPARIVVRDDETVEGVAAAPEEPGERETAAEPASRRSSRGRSADRDSQPDSPRLDESASPSRTATAGEPSAGEIAASARHILDTMLTKMGFEAEVTLRTGDEPVTLDVRGDDLGVLIGRRGESLASLQFMLNVMLSKQYHEWPKVVIDVEGYRARREQSLSSLGLRVADRVRRNRRPFTLEAMPANDRRIIHLSLRDRSDVETYSIGEGPARRVVIAPRR